MVEATVVLASPTGLHARAAAAVLRRAASFNAEVTLVDVDRDPRRTASAASVLALLSLGARKGDRISVRATGPDARDALAAVTDALAATAAHPADP